jgi:O-antigen biosynthesis protein WbqP
LDISKNGLGNQRTTYDNLAGSSVRSTAESAVSCINRHETFCEFIKFEITLLSQQYEKILDKIIMFKRLFDFIMALFASLFLSIPMLTVALVVKFTSPGPILYWSDRVGRYNIIFKMPKFRTMRIDTPAVATHLLGDPDRWLTPIGKFLRKSSLDELPQLFSILKGDMSIVGPRPALFNQQDLIELRTKKGVHELTPGLTGWAQINGRDELPIPLKVELDEYYLRNQSFALDLRIIFLTVMKVLKSEGVTH